MVRALAWLGVLAVLLLPAGCDSGGTAPPAKPAMNQAAPNPTAPAAPPPPAPTGVSVVPPAPGGAPQPVAPPAAPGLGVPPAMPGAPPAAAGSAVDQAKANLGQIAQAAGEYQKKHNCFPPPALFGPDGRPLLSWRVALLPMLGQEELFKQFHLDEAWDSQHNQTLLARMPAVFQCPGGPPAPKTCIQAPIGSDTILSEKQGMTAEAVRDGLANTILIVETDADRAAPWTQPQDWQYIPAQPTEGLGKLRDGALLCATADGTVHQLSAAIDPAALRALFSAAGGEPVDLAKWLGGEPPAAEPNAAAATVSARPKVDLSALAKAAMSQGNERQAVGYLMADAVMSGRGEVLDSFRWSPGLKRPMLVTRWGLATLSALPNTSGVAGAGGGVKAGGVKAGGVKAGGAKLGGVPPGGAADPRPGGPAVARGAVFSIQPNGARPKHVAPQPAAPPAGRNPPRGGRGDPAGNLPGNNLGQTGAIADPFAFWRETIGDPLLESLQSRVAAGGFGAWFKGAERQAAPGGQPAAPLPNPLNPLPGVPGAVGVQNLPPGLLNAANHAASGASAARGITIVEGESLADLRVVALREGLDVLLVAEVSEKPIRRGPSQSTIVLHLIDVAKDAKLWTSKPLNNVKVAAAQQSGKEGGPAADLLDDAAKCIDKQLQLVEMPKIGAEAAQRRAASLAAEKQTNPLPALVELRYYETKKLITSEQFAAHAVKIAGPGTGRRLVAGNEDDRLKVLEQWLGGQ